MVFPIILLLLIWLVIEIDFLRTAAKNMNCHGKMSQLTLMFNNHIVLFKTFPPVAIIDADGIPLHSWRMMLFKDNEEFDLYGYNYDEIWNSTNNIEAIKNIDADKFGAFRKFYCPLNEKKGVANYVAIVTDSGQWYTTLCDESFSQEVLLVICDSFSKIKVAEPKDITLEQAWCIFKRESSKKDILGRNMRKNIGVFWNFDEKKVVCREYTREDLLLLQSLSNGRSTPENEASNTQTDQN